MLDTKQAAALIGISVNALQQLRLRKTGPKWTTKGWSVQYEEKDVAEWLVSKKRRKIKMKRGKRK